MCGKPGKGRQGTSHHAKAIYQIISSSRSRDICYESVNGRTNGRTDGQGDCNIILVYFIVGYFYKQLPV
jgi:hypothetical protein